jgi:hypothetical protein
MREAIKGGLQPQPLHHGIIYTQQNKNLGNLVNFSTTTYTSLTKMESSYATSKGCKTALQSEPRREGSLLPGYSIPGNSSGHLSVAEHMPC